MLKGIVRLDFESREIVFSVLDVADSKCTSAPRSFPLGAVFIEAVIAELVCDFLAAIEAVDVVVVAKVAKFTSFSASSANLGSSLLEGVPHIELATMVTRVAEVRDIAVKRQLFHRLDRRIFQTLDGCQGCSGKFLKHSGLIVVIWRPRSSYVQINAY